MHDYFDILGLTRDARALEIADACRRRLGRPHPDVDDGDEAAAPGRDADGGPATIGDSSRAEIAIDFASMGPIIARMRLAFFRAGS